MAVGPSQAQQAPSAVEMAAYRGIHAAVAGNDLDQVQYLIEQRADLDQRDSHGRTPLMVAAYTGNRRVAEVLISAGADVDALDSQRYDALTITAVKNDPPFLQLLLDAGANPGAVTSPYDGTALIAACHLGHVEVVQKLIAAGAPVDHVNNLGWTALIEAIVLGDGDPNYQEIVSALITAGADVDLADRQGATPRVLASRYGYAKIEDLLAKAGALY